MAAIQHAIPAFDRLGVRVLAASADDLDGAQQIVAELGLAFPVAYGVQSEQIALLKAVEGVRKGKAIVQPAEFVLNPSGEVAASMYATTQLGRMNPVEILNYLESRVVR